MTELKQPTSIDEQIAILERHGCIVSDTSLATKVLSTINYYRFSAYFLPFKQADGTYKTGTTFEKVLSLYEFDSEFRALLFSAIECIEVALRARLSYLHGMKYGSLGYLDSANFNPRHDEIKFNSNLQREISSNHKVPFVKHHLENYGGKFPVWVVSELFTFGMLSYFYSDMLTQDKKEIARQYNTNYRVLGSWLRCCTDARNICAHYGRLYYRVFTASPSGFDLPESVRHRAWAVMLVIKALYPSHDKWQAEFMPRMNSLMEKYAENINLYHLAFPENWNEELSN